MAIILSTPKFDAIALKTQIKVTIWEYFNFLLLTSSKYLAVTEVNPIAVVKQAKATIIPSNRIPFFPSKWLVIFTSNSVWDMDASYIVDTVAPKYAKPPYTRISPIPAIRADFKVIDIFSFLSLYPLFTKEVIIKAVTPPIPKASIVWYPWVIPLTNNPSLLLLLSSPIGDKIPFPINNIKASNKTGVKNLPIISITFVGLIVNISVRPKNSRENTAEFNEEVMGIILISKVVAAVLGITNIGPRHSIIIISK